MLHKVHCCNIFMIFKWEIFVFISVQNVCYMNILSSCGTLLLAQRGILAPFLRVRGGVNIHEGHTEKYLDHSESRKSSDVNFTLPSGLEGRIGKLVGVRGM